MEVLKKCPFCDGDAQVQINEIVEAGEVVQYFGVICKNCGSRTSQWYQSPEEAVDAWNQRV